MTALHLAVLGIESTNFSNSAEVITRNHELMIASMRLVLLPGSFCINLFSRDHKFSTGLRSGLFPLSRPSKQLDIVLLKVGTIWYRHELCGIWCSIVLKYEVATTSNRPWAEGSIFDSSTSLMYLLECIFPSSTWILPLLFSERSLYAIARPSVCLSVVCNARAPYSGGSNFPQ